MPSPSMASRIERWPIDRLVPHARNPRTHSDAQVAQIAASITEFGFTSPILVDSEAGILAGHGRLMAARKLNLAEVPVIVLDGLSPAQRQAYIIADNKLAENAGWDEEMLRAAFADLRAVEFNTDLTGFGLAELERLFPQGPTEAEDVCPEPLPEAVSRLGDLWMMGDHRVLCGDATDADHVARLLGSLKMDMVLTDPPYCSGGFQESGRLAGSIDTRIYGPH